MAESTAVPGRTPSKISVPGNSGVKVVRTCTIRKPAAELYKFWRDFSNLPQIIRHPVEIKVLSPTESEWSVSAPFSVKKIGWRATVINDKPPHLIAWRSNPDSEVPNAGSVRFEKAPGDEGTEVTVALEFDPPGGRLGGFIAKLSSDEPGRQVADTLRRFKALCEAGEIPTIEGQSVGEPQRSQKAMKAVTWMGKKSVEVQTVDDPRILNPRDCIVKITATAICGSDLHLYDGYVPTMMKGDILGHEFMGEVVEVGRGVKQTRVGDRVVVPFTISCGGCSHCLRQQWAACDNGNPNPEIVDTLYGHGGAGMFGYSHMMGGYAGGQAQYARVPFADVGPLKIESDLPDEKVLFLSDIFPTGYMAAENCRIKPGQSIVAVWGCGPVGQFAIRSAFLLGAAKVIAIDREPERLAMAKAAGAITLRDDEDDIHPRLLELTGGRGPDAAIDAVGMEAHGSMVDQVKQSLKLTQDRPHALREAMRAVRKVGVLSVPGVYAGYLDKVPFGAAFGKGITITGGQTHMHKYMQPLLKLVEDGKIDPSFVVTHRVPLTKAPEAYETFLKKQDGCIKVILNPDE